MKDRISPLNEYDEFKGATITSFGEDYKTGLLDSLEFKKNGKTYLVKPFQGAHEIFMEVIDVEEYNKKEDLKDKEE